jgi:hypothetical protein
MHQTGKTRHQSRQIFDWFGCVSPLLVARLCSLRLSLALLRKRRDMRRGQRKPGASGRKCSPTMAIAAAAWHCASHAPVRRPVPRRRCATTWPGSGASTRRPRRLGMFNVLGMAVEVLRGSIGSVDARQSRRAKGGGLPRCDEWRARDESTLRMCKCNPRCAPPRTLLRCREQAPQRCRREGLHVRTERRFLARRLLVPDDR